MIFKTNELSTFKQLSGSPDWLVTQATGLGGVDELSEAIVTKKTKLAVDALVPSPCNGGGGNGCEQCFFTEDPLGKVLNNVPVTPELLQDVRNFIDGLDPNNIALTIYPREITTAKGLLQVFEDFGISKALTNAILLKNKAYVDMLINSGITQISVSVLGNPAEQAYLGNSFEAVYWQILQGIQNAIEAGIEVSVFTVVYQGNIDSLQDIFRTLSQLGVKKCQLIRLVPTGKAQNMPDKDFITNNEDVLKVLFAVDEARRQNPELRISLSKFGPNFYSPGIYQYLLNSNVWPYSKYFCPWIDQGYIGVIFGSNRVVPCFQGMSFPELDIGEYREGEVIINETPLTVANLQENLRGICSSENCKFQSLCNGGCRITAYSFAKRNGEGNPLYAGQDVCLTNILQEI
jgi:radical SAM protein with 4Fe4S-binding SPASM domain